jgi:hypothetical protein
MNKNIGIDEADALAPKILVGEVFDAVIKAQNRQIIRDAGTWLHHTEIATRLGAVLPADHQAGMKTALTAVFSHLLTASPDQLLAMTTALRDAIEATATATAAPASTKDQQPALVTA